MSRIKNQSIFFDNFSLYFYDLILTNCCFYFDFRRENSVEGSGSVDVGEEAANVDFTDSGRHRLKGLARNTHESYAEAMQNTYKLKETTKS